MSARDEAPAGCGHRSRQAVFSRFYAQTIATPAARPIAKAPASPDTGPLFSKLQCQSTFMLKLIFDRGAREPLWVLDKVFVIGSAEECDLALEGQGLAPQHARVQSRDQQVILKDLGSTAGTFVNGQRITQRQLNNGDRVRLGQLEFTVWDPFAENSIQQDWCLVGVTGWLAGQEFALGDAGGKRRLLVGRGAHCDVILPNTHLSREHAEFELGAESISVRDLDSANGTFIDDVRLHVGEPALATPGAVLRFDIYSFKLLGPRRSATAAQPQDAAPLTPRQWRTAPTSPGNRSEPQNSRRGGAAMVIAAVLLVLAVAGLVYLFV